jgi:hypothetical protein
MTIAAPRARLLIRRVPLKHWIDNQPLAIGVFMLTANDSKYQSASQKPGVIWPRLMFHPFPPIELQELMSAARFIKS